MNFVKKVCVVSVLVSLMVVASAATLSGTPRLGASVYAGGLGGAMLGVNTDAYTFEVGYYTKSDDAAQKSEANVITLLGLLKSQFAKNTFLTYGGYYQTTTGKINYLGTSYALDSMYTYGAIVGVQYEVNEILLLSISYSPYTTNATKFAGTETKTTYMGYSTIFGATLLF